MTPTPRQPAAPAQRVLLVGWDGADWKIASPLIDAGAMPQLANIVEHGASGPLASLPPYLSPMLWNSIATGKYADQHGILGFTATDPATGRLTAVTSTQRKCKALWNILSEHERTTHVIGWFASHPAENVNGVCVTEAFPRLVAKGAPWPLPAGAVHPPELAGELAEFRVRPEDITADILRLFVPRLDEIDHAKDHRVQQLAVRLAELYSVHNAAIAALDRGPCDFLAVYYHFIDWVCHDFMDFHPPRRPHVAEREFEWYQYVVKAAYTLQDLLLGDLLQHAGAGSTVVLCSDHGFHSDHRRPGRIPMVSAGIALWHRAQGLFAAAGPGIARDVLVSGATVLDLAPTILHLLGLSAAADMDGRILSSVLAPGTPAPTHTSSYEVIPGPTPRPRYLTTLSETEHTALLEQFAALGYVDLAQAPGADSPAVQAERDNAWNLAITLRHAGRNEQALPILERLHLARPEDARYAYHLAMCQLHVGLAAQAAVSAETIADYAPDSSAAREMLAELALSRGDPEAALHHLDAPGVTETPEGARQLLQRGRALLQLRRTLEACTVLRAAIEADEEDPVAWLGYAQALLQANHPADAETCARQAIALAPTMAIAHFTLGQALVLLGRPIEAQAAWRQAQVLNPRLDPATQGLAQLEGQPYLATTEHLSDRVEGRLLDDLRLASVQLRNDQGVTCANQRETIAPLAGFVTHAETSPPPDAAAKPLVIVSGLPRSGTSLMMQILARGGLPPMTDGQRTPDISNPEGYFEWEKVKTLPHNPAILDGAVGKALKVVSPLLVHLPAHRRYKVIFMLRPPDEIARSQARMRRRTESDAPAAATMVPLLARHQAATLEALRGTSAVDLLVVDYPALVVTPAAECARVAEFLGAELLPRAHAMPGAVRPELHRERMLQPSAA